MRISLVVAVVGGILFAVGLLGTIATSAAVPNLGPDYAHDCVLLNVGSDCPARLAAIQRVQATVLTFEILGILGFVLIIVGFGTDVVRKRATMPPKK